MLVIGAKGFAKNVLEVIYQNNQLENLVFYDDVSDDLPEKFFNQFEIIRNFENAKTYFNTIDNHFTIGIGNPRLRKLLYDKFIESGAKFCSTISPKADIGHFGNIIAEGCNIMSGVVVSNNVQIDKGVILNLNCTVGHDSHIKEFAEISPSANICGNCIIGTYSSIGTNATVLPKVIIGKNVTVGAGTVVTKNIPDNAVVVGVPGKIIKYSEALNY